MGRQFVNSRNSVRKYGHSILAREASAEISSRGELRAYEEVNLTIKIMVQKT